MDREYEVVVGLPETWDWLCIAAAVATMLDDDYLVDSMRESLERSLPMIRAAKLKQKENRNNE